MLNPSNAFQAKEDLGWGAPQRAGWTRTTGTRVIARGSGCNSAGRDERTGKLQACRTCCCWAAVPGSRRLVAETAPAMAASHPSKVAKKLAHPNAEKKLSHKAARPGLEYATL